MYRHVNANVALTSIKPQDLASQSASRIHSRVGGLFEMTLMTSNAPIDLSLVSAPLNSTIQIYSTTSNSHSSAKVWRAFEGPFELSTSNAPLTAEVKMNSEDDPQLTLPEHLDGRKPAIIVTSPNKRQVSGSFWWGETGARSTLSKATMSTSNGPLYFAII